MKYRYVTWWTNASQEQRSSIVDKARLIYGGFRLEACKRWTVPGKAVSDEPLKMLYEHEWQHLSPSERSAIERTLYYTWRKKYNVPANRIEWPANVSSRPFLS